MKSELLLFPLQVVMFPGSKIPLYIFEERYKYLVSTSLRQESEFGIVLVFEGKLETTGTSVLVDEVIKESENGEFNIIVEGRRRFRLYNYQILENGLYKGMVDFLDDNYSDHDKEVMIEAVSSYNTIVEKAYKGSVKAISADDERFADGKRSVCFYMAEKSGLGLAEKQRLLEIDSENERLQYLMNYFSDILPKLEQAERIADIIKSDGYLQ